MGGPGLGQWTDARGVGGRVKETEWEWGHLRPVPGPQSREAGVLIIR